MIGRIVASINIGVLILRTCEHGIFHGKRNFAGAKNSLSKGKSKAGESENMTKMVE